MGIITRMRKQKAAYWSPSGFDSFGNASFEDPIEIDCRWEDRHQLFMDENGVEQVSNAVVYVDRVVELRGYLRLGTLDSLAGSSPLDNSGVYQIRKYEELPNLKNTEILRTAVL